MVCDTMKVQNYSVQTIPAIGGQISRSLNNKKELLGYGGDFTWPSKVNQMQSGAEAERAFLLRSIHMKTINKNSNQICILLKSTCC